MIYFPIKVKMTKNDEIKIFKDPKEIPSGERFTVLEINTKG
jgi:hypothetical protein